MSTRPRILLALLAILTGASLTWNWIQHSRLSALRNRLKSTAADVAKSATTLLPDAPLPAGVPVADADALGSSTAAATSASEAEIQAALEELSQAALAFKGHGDLISLTASAEASGDNALASAGEIVFTMAFARRFLEPLTAQFRRQFTSLKARLNLTAAQEQILRPRYENHAMAELSRLFSESGPGNSTGDELFEALAPEAFWGYFPPELDQTLSQNQRVALLAIIDEKRTEVAESTANANLLELEAVITLAPEQKDRLVQRVAEVIARDFDAFRAGKPTSGKPNGPPGRDKFLQEFLTAEQLAELGRHDPALRDRSTWSAMRLTFATAAEK